MEVKSLGHQTARFGGQGQSKLAFGKAACPRHSSLHASLGCPSNVVERLVDSSCGVLDHVAACTYPDATIAKKQLQ